MKTDDLERLWRIDLQREPAAAVMPCRCGAMPAPVTNVAGDARRRCCRCYVRDMGLAWDHWEN